MDWIIEAVIENENIKRDLFTDLDGITGAEVPLASNTSSIPISRLASGLRFPERLLGLHFFGPVPLMELVEVIQSSRTSNAIFERGIAFARALGKHPVSVRGDIPGFVMNRVFAAAFRECLELVTSGVARVEDIDAGMRLGYGWKAGPFEIADNAGIDTVLNVSRSLKSLDEQHLAANTDVLEKMVDSGQLGRKSGRGFYLYNKDGSKQEA
jgi:3-hydroxybutyryl-CoA dehydrogenase